MWILWDASLSLFKTILRRILLYVLLLHYVYYDMTIIIFCFTHTHTQSQPAHIKFYSGWSWTSVIKRNSLHGSGSWTGCQCQVHDDINGERFEGARTQKKKYWCVTTAFMFGCPIFPSLVQRNKILILKRFLPGTRSQLIRQSVPLLFACKWHQIMHSSLHIGKKILPFAKIQCLGQRRMRKRTVVQFCGRRKKIPYIEDHLSINFEINEEVNRVLWCPIFL